MISVLLMTYGEAMLSKVIGVGWVLPLKLTTIVNEMWWWKVLLLGPKLVSMQFAMEFGNALWSNLA